MVKNRFLDNQTSVAEYTTDHFKDMIRHAMEVDDFEDLYFRLDEKVIVRSRSANYELSHKVVKENEMSSFVSEIYDAGVWQDALRGIPYADSFAIPKKKGDVRTREFYRFRVNISRNRGAFEKRGVSIVMRAITDDVPTFDQLKVREVIRNNFIPRQGLVVIAGETGSGKSTLLASAINAILSDHEVDSVICEYADPIEYVYDKVDKGHSIIMQHAVGERRDIIDFASGIKNALRQDSTKIIIGECRDHETVSALIRAAGVGNACYSTFHANSVSSVFMGMVNMFGEHERAAKALQLVKQMRMVVVQYLARVNDRRIPVQEVLVFNKEIERRLVDCDYKNLFAVLDDCVSEFGITMTADAENLLKEGKLDNLTYKYILSGI